MKSKDQILLEDAYQKTLDGNSFREHSYQNYDETEVYELVKNGKWSLADFDFWVSSVWFTGLNSKESKK